MKGCCPILERLNHVNNPKPNAHELLGIRYFGGSTLVVTSPVMTSEVNQAKDRQIEQKPKRTSPQI
jgi:hypothetical protein